MAGRYRKVFHAVTGGVPTVPQSAEAMMKRIRTNLASYLLD
jgi:hypothetical protein